MKTQSCLYIETKVLKLSIDTSCREVSSKMFTPWKKKTPPKTEATVRWLQPAKLSMQKTALACSCRRDSRSVTPGALPIHQQALCQAYPAGGFLAWRRDLHDLWLVKWMTPACFPVSDGMRGLTRGFYTDPFRPFTLGGERKCQTARRASPRPSVSAIAARSGHVCNCHALRTWLQQCVVSCATLHFTLTDIVSDTISQSNRPSSGRGPPAKTPLEKHCGALLNLYFVDFVAENPSCCRLSHPHAIFCSSSFLFPFSPFLNVEVH